MSVEMNASIILRFRDLVSEPGETITEHQSICRVYGHTWWGWMKRDGETVPRTFLGDALNQIEADMPRPAYLWDTDRLKFYECRLIRIAVAPGETRIGSPEPEKTPEYYNRGRYAGWFLLSNIVEQSIPRMKYHSFPTVPNEHRHAHLIGSDVGGHLHAEAGDVTLWVVMITP
jgi:hypothetical protein